MLKLQLAWLNCDDGTRGRSGHPALRARHVSSSHVEKLLAQIGGRKPEVRAEEAAARNERSPRCPAIEREAEEHPYLARMIDQRPDDRLEINPTLGIGCDQRRWRQGTVRWIGNDAERRERDTVLDRNAGRHMGFHVNGDSAGLSVKLPFRIDAGDWRVGPDDVAE